MLPLVLPPNSVSIGVVGRGEPLAARIRMLDRAGVTKRQVFDERYPTPEELSGFDVLFVAGLGDAESRDFHAAAKERRILINVEDVPKLCDFHVPAQIRRGDLLITVSTGGRSPGLSSAVREYVEEIFGEEWEGRLKEMSVTRARWRSSGLSPKAVAEKTKEYIAKKGWIGEGGSR